LSFDLNLDHLKTFKSNYIFLAHGGEDYERFLSLIGDKIELKGWKGFAGGLDARENTTGTHSYFTTWNDYELMYHVATMLPMEAGDQQVQKKRHLGNDIILVVFQEEGSEPFIPNCVKSNYIRKCWINKRIKRVYSRH